MADEKKEPTETEIWQRKIDNIIQSLTDSKNFAEEQAKDYAVKLASRYDDRSDKASQFRKEFFLKYKIAEAEADAFNVAINQVTASMMYG